MILLLHNFLTIVLLMQLVFEDLKAALEEAKMVYNLSKHATFYLEALCFKYMLWWLRLCVFQCISYYFPGHEALKSGFCCICFIRGEISIIYLVKLLKAFDILSFVY